MTRVSNNSTPIFRTLNLNARAESASMVWPPETDPPPPPAAATPCGGRSHAGKGLLPALPAGNAPLGGSPPQAAGGKRAGQLARFRKRASSGVKTGSVPRVSDFDIEAARRVDLTSYLESMGLVVKRDGRRHLTVQRHGEEVYRGTLRSDDHYVWCDRYQGGIGDNIALVREIVPGTGFSAAVNQLSGAPAVDPRHAPSPPPPHTPPKLPPNTDSARAAGRCYLQGRGITLSTIDHAEQVGMVRYVDGGVLFVGYVTSMAYRRTLHAAPLPLLTGCKSATCVAATKAIRRSCLVNLQRSGSSRVAQTPSPCTTSPSATASHLLP